MVNVVYLYLLPRRGREKGGKMEGILQEHNSGGAFTPNGKDKTYYISSEACILLQKKATYCIEMYSRSSSQDGSLYYVYEVTIDDDVYNDILLIDKL